MRKLRQRAVKWPVQHCRDGKWWIWVATPGSLSLALPHPTILKHYATIQATACYLLIKIFVSLICKNFICVVNHCLFNGNHIQFLEKNLQTTFIVLAWLYNNSFNFSGKVFLCITKYICQNFHFQFFILSRLVLHSVG